MRGLITAFFAPVFFGIAGLSADLTILADPEIALFTAGLVLVASLGKFGGAFIGAELGGLTRREGLALACGMNARGSTEVIIATVGLSMGALNQNLFTMIVAMAVLTTMAMPPTLRWALSRIPMRKEEKQRLEREEFEQRGFVLNLERLLVAVDDSPNGKFALRVAGVLAGTHGMPATVLHIPDASKIESTMPDYPEKVAAGASKPPEKSSEQKKSEGKQDNGKAIEKTDEKTDEVKEKAEEAGDAVQQAAAQIKSKQKKEEKVDTPIEVTTVVHEQPSPALIAEEAEKGYDIFIIGIEETSKKRHEFGDGVTNLAKGFDGPLIVSAVRDDLEEKPDGKLDILVPVNGTEVSRRAAEVAITMARATKAQVTVLYVAVRTATRRGARRGIRTRRHEEAILKDIVAIADGYNMSIRTAVVADGPPTRRSSQNSSAAITIWWCWASAAGRERDFSSATRRLRCSRYPNARCCSWRAEKEPSHANACAPGQVPAIPLRPRRPSRRSCRCHCSAGCEICCFSESPSARCAPHRRDCRASPSAPSWAA